MHSKKIIIFGGTGFIGSNIAAFLQKSNHLITIVSRKKVVEKDLLKSKNVDYKNCNILNFKEVSQIIIGADVVINCTGHSGIKQSMSNPVRNWRVNCEGIINILEACRKRNVTCKIIQIGSQLEVSDKEDLNSSVDSPYGLSKLCASQYVKYYIENYRINATVLRLPNVYGPHHKIKNKDYGILNYFIDLAMINKKIPIFSNGLEERNFVYIDDVVILINKIIDSKKSYNGIINVKANKKNTIIEAAEKIIKIIGFGQIKYCETSNKTNKKVNDNVNYKMLEYKTKTSLINGLKLTIKRQKNIVSKLDHEK